MRFFFSGWFTLCFSSTVLRLLSPLIHIVTVSSVPEFELQSSQIRSSELGLFLGVNLTVRS